MDSVNNAGMSRSPRVLQTVTQVIETLGGVDAVRDLVGAVSYTHLTLPTILRV